jgi:hypothetical protein
MLPDDDASEEGADAWDAREVAVDEHVSADVIVPALGGIGVPDTNAAVAAKEGVEAARVHQEQHVMRRRNWCRTECRVIIGFRSWRAVCEAAEFSETFRSPSYTVFRGGMAHGTTARGRCNESKQLLRSTATAPVDMADRIKPHSAHVITSRTIENHTPLYIVCERSEREYPWACVCTLRCSVIFSINVCVRVWVFARR